MGSAGKGEKLLQQFRGEYVGQGTWRKSGRKKPRSSMRNEGRGGQGGRSSERAALLWRNQFKVKVMQAAMEGLARVRVIETAPRVSAWEEL